MTPRTASPPGSSVHGNLQARILEWVAMPSSRGSSPPRDGICLEADSLPLSHLDAPSPLSVQFSSAQSLSRVCLFATPWTAARQASLSITNSLSLHKLMSIKLAMPSNHLILCRPLLLLPPIPPSIRVFSRVSSSHEVAKVLEFQLQHQSFQ